ncbi:serine/threonine protein kinase, partial [Staphylococcus lutrae]
ELNVLLNKYDAPYILNDLRYKDCKSVYFRYGRLRILSDESEEERKYIKLKNNKIILDPRLPYFYLPPEIDWPFEFKEPESESDDSLLLKNKYEVIDAFSLSSKGGVYLAKYNEKECIIKEFRPHVYNNNWEGQQIFCNEKKIYEKLFEFDFCPKLIDSFQEWEHYFLVVEKVNGETLTNYLAKNTEIYQSKQKKDAYIDNT